MVAMFLLDIASIPETENHRQRADFRKEWTRVFIREEFLHAVGVIKNALKFADVGLLYNLVSRLFSAVLI